MRRASPRMSEITPAREMKKRMKKMVCLSLFSPKDLSPSGYGDLLQKLQLLQDFARSPGHSGEGIVSLDGGQARIF